MITKMTPIAASEHISDLRRAADSRRLAKLASDPEPGAETQQGAVLLHFARPDDSGLVTRLAELDDATPLEGEILIAFVAGEAVAALSLTEGRVVANPFVLTADAVALLRLREQHLRRERGHRSWRTILRPRVAVSRA
jgi:hypothetical protein